MVRFMSAVQIVMMGAGEDNLGKRSDMQSRYTCHRADDWFACEDVT